MKKAHHSFICILICLAPIHLIGQALQVQNPLPGISSPNTDLIPQRSLMTDPPLLRLSHQGPPGLEQIQIELVPLSLQSTGPILVLDQGDPMMPWDGVVSLLPNFQGAPLHIDNLGSSGQDGVRLRVGVPPTLDSFFDIFYDAAAGTETHIAGDPDFDLLWTRTYDKATPKLLERISSTTSGVESFFDVFYDLQLGQETRVFGDPDFDLLLTRTYDKATPKLLERISSGNAGTENFFAISHDLSLGMEVRSYGASFDDLRVECTFDKATPKLSERIVSGNPLFADHFFDITYNLHHPSGGGGAGKVSFSDLHFSTEFFPDTPRLSQVISSTNPLYADRFFDIAYDLDVNGTGSGAKQTSFGTLSEYKLYFPGAPEFGTLLYSTDPTLADHFFDITYNLSSGAGGGAGKVSYADLSLSTVFLPDTPRLSQVISSGNLLYADSFFDITYDLSDGRRGVQCHELRLLETFDALMPVIRRRMESTSADFAGRFIEERYDIQTEMVPLHLTSCGFPGLAPIEVRYEYDGLNRLVREVVTDGSSGVALSLERNLSPSNPRLLVAGGLTINGGALTSDTGPLLMLGDIQMEGGVVVEGSLMVNGPKMFRIEHPLDPDNKYLIHSCVESPDMMNVYNGNIMTDANGYATVQLPDYFEALNADFRYQLTCMGQFAQAMISQKILNNRFVIRTDKPNVEVSWQVTGIRHDPAALNSGYTVELKKEVLVE